MSTSTLQYRIRRILKRAGITGPRLGTQAMRHTFAVNYLRAGGSVFTLGRILGHRSEVKDSVVINQSVPFIVETLLKFRIGAKQQPIPVVGRRHQADDAPAGEGIQNPAFPQVDAMLGHWPQDRANLGLQ